MIKYGRGVKLSEAQNMKFVTRHTTIPVPEVFDSYTRNRITYIIMAYIPGDSLESAWPNLNTSEKGEIAHSLGDLLGQLRKIKSPYFGNLDRQPYEHDAFRLSVTEKGGPFDSEADLVTTMLRVAGGGPYSFRRFQQLSACLYGHEAVFTHSDIQPKNIMIERVEKMKNKSTFKLTIIDWEASGFYPSWWEYDSALSPLPRDDWVDFLPIIVGDKYVSQHLFMQGIRGIPF